MSEANAKVSVEMRIERPTPLFARVAKWRPIKALPSKAKQHP
jgi:hypothetical protein